MQTYFGLVYMEFDSKYNQSSLNLHSNYITKNPLSIKTMKQLFFVYKTMKQLLFYLYIKWN